MDTKPQFPERRLQSRGILQMPGTVLREDGLPPIACTVIGMSQSGASINTRDTLPDEFVLSLAANASVLRKCKVIWREGFMVGIQFIPKPKNTAVDAKGGRRSPQG
jgi:PilZ domain